MRAVRPLLPFFLMTLAASCSGGRGGTEAGNPARPPIQVELGPNQSSEVSLLAVCARRLTLVANDGGTHVTSLEANERVLGGSPTALTEIYAGSATYDRAELELNGSCGGGHAIRITNLASTFQASDVTLRFQGPFTVESSTRVLTLHVQPIVNELEDVTSDLELQTVVTTTSGSVAASAGAVDLEVPIEMLDAGVNGAIGSSRTFERIRRFSAPVRSASFPAAGISIRPATPAERPGAWRASWWFHSEAIELALAVDQIAERIRALGFPAPGTYAEFMELSSIKEERGNPPAERMIELLVEGQEAVVRTARSIFPVVDRAADEPTADLLTQRMQVHEKTAWMLRSMLERQPSTPPRL